MKTLTKDDIEKINAALNLIDFDLEVARGLLSKLRDDGTLLKDAKSALATAALLIGGADDWEDLGQLLPKK